MKRTAFYDAVRSTLFGGKLSQSQVAGIDALLDELERNGVALEQSAYVLAGVYHETGRKMVPVREGFASTDAGARATVKKLFEKGRIKTNYAAPVNGVSYYGRGRIQNTWLANYEKLEKRFGRPFAKQPDLLLDDAIDAEVTVIGHVEGIWTGKKLADYIGNGKKDYVGARRIVNGTDKAAMIAGYAESFEKALKAAAYSGKPSTAPKPATPAAPAKASWLSALIKALVAIFKGGKK